ncbi:unnamed protein product [Vitrella brassicaformis CCMP3155]|uniref:Uncharacterized protein n=1 Tax=Vitrella brassicaformis (strain CCMP3155) TaxID=1169540 RepID=A0A0G4H4V2_VITBC|nr:unnamed protein product [Vitrella brassicaformis CCMP3155]|eukprot:CEM38813.1 unnamed protein product [Vitrella brassicaformis CCMP3155]
MVPIAVVLALLVGLCGTVQTASDQPQTGGCIGRDASCPLSEGKSAFIEKHGGSVSAASLQTALGEAKRIAQAAHTVSGKALTAGDKALTASGKAVTALDALTTTILKQTGRPDTASASLQGGRIGAIDVYAMHGLKYAFFFDVGGGPGGHLASCSKNEGCVIDEVEFENIRGSGHPANSHGLGTCQATCGDGQVYNLEFGGGKFCIRPGTMIMHVNADDKRIFTDKPAEPLAVSYGFHMAKGEKYMYDIIFPGHQMYQ